MIKKSESSAEARLGRNDPQLTTECYGSLSATREPGPGRAGIWECGMGMDEQGSMGVRRHLIELRAQRQVFRTMQAAHSSPSFSRVGCLPAWVWRKGRALMWLGAHFGGLTQILNSAQPTRDAGWMGDRVDGGGIDKQWWYKRYKTARVAREKWRSRRGLSRSCFSILVKRFPSSIPSCQVSLVLLRVFLFFACCEELNLFRGMVHTQRCSSR
ncbi:hypothetical protein CCHR01_06898 [Colletotrichum chrysophilum]|uniref:Uncharacterized protein n=1 Tax=Colletotrichum chrysophilum TaxID=1836956 RepID=A0AAD9APT4_9PEZI|nr:hypothetical protein CCHR01_06898 [Colletotrichum chrysophilum]